MGSQRLLNLTTLSVGVEHEHTIPLEVSVLGECKDVSRPSLHLAFDRECSSRVTSGRQEEGCYARDERQDAEDTLHLESIAVSELASRSDSALQFQSALGDEVP